MDIFRLSAACIPARISPFDTNVSAPYFFKECRCRPRSPIRRQLNQSGRSRDLIFAGKGGQTSASETVRIRRRAGTSGSFPGVSAPGPHSVQNKKLKAVKIERQRNRSIGGRKRDVAPAPNSCTFSTVPNGERPSHWRGNEQRAECHGR
jgi:hypothetical protein